MSGGSYNYLGGKSTVDLVDSQQDIQDMADRLAGLGYADDAAEEAQNMLLTIRQFDNRISVMQGRLQGIFKAVEWWDSCDSGEDGVKQALKEYRGE